MNPHIIASAIVKRLPELQRDSTINAENTIANMIKDEYLDVQGPLFEREQLREELAAEKTLTMMWQAAAIVGWITTLVILGMM
jgi:hypothetical protein